jgi:hypothetical protein
MTGKDLLPGKGQFLVYEAEDGQVKIDVRLEDETVWLTQQRMADLFFRFPRSCVGTLPIRRVSIGAPTRSVGVRDKRAN